MMAASFSSFISSVRHFASHWAVPVQGERDMVFAPDRRRCNIQVTLRFSVQNHHPFSALALPHHRLDTAGRSSRFQMQSIPPGPRRLKEVGIFVVGSRKRTMPSPRVFGRSDQHRGRVFPPLGSRPRGYMFQAAFLLPCFQSNTPYRTFSLLAVRHQHHPRSLNRRTCG